jgi:hypothetical protein
MGLSGLDSDAALEHDVVESWRHSIDKEALAKRKLGEWVFIPRPLEYEFQNDFSAIRPRDALYFQGAGIPTITVSSIDPEPWDESGTMASFSAGSGAAVLREFFRQQGRRARGRKAAGAVADRELPAPPSGIPMAPPTLKLVGPLEHLKWLRLIRDESRTYHRWATGADLRLQWKSTPASTRTTSTEGDAGPGMIDESIDAIKSGSTSKPGERTIREVKEGSDLRRYTINTHPALARALSKMVAAGEKDRVIAVMAELAPRVAAKFQEITGRRCVALSVHFDSNLPHWNIWHCGTERVIYPIGKKERERYRRTAFDLNSSGSLLAWHRTRFAFERLGKDFKALSSRTVNELEKGFKRAMDRQGRPPGDWTINEEADRLLEDALRTSGKETEIEAGFAEFVQNEEKRYRDGGAGREPKDGRKLAVLLRDDESVGDAIERLKRAEEIQAIEQALRPSGGETLSEAAARVVERTGSLADELERSSQDAAALRAERDGLKVQVGESATVLSQVKSVLKPDSDEPLLEAAKRVTAGAEEAEALKSRVEEMEAEGKKLRGERDDFKSQVAKGVKTLEKVKTTIALEPGKDLIPALERTVNEAASVHALMQQAGKLQGELASSCASLQQEQEKVRRLEEEIGPFRILWPLVEKLLELLNKSPLVQKLDAKIKALLHEIGNHVKVPFNPEIKQKPSLETEQEM